MKGNCLTYAHGDMRFLCIESRLLHSDGEPLPARDFLIARKIVPDLPAILPMVESEFESVGTGCHWSFLGRANEDHIVGNAIRCCSRAISRVEFTSVANILTRLIHRDSLVIKTILVCERITDLRALNVQGASKMSHLCFSIEEGLIAATCCPLSTPIKGMDNERMLVVRSSRR